MKIIRRIMFASTFLLLCSSVLPARSSDDGGVSSSAPVTAQPTASGDPKQLPWKFLASPMGVLDQTWTADAIKGFGSHPELWDCKKSPQDCTPHRIEKLVKDTVGVDLNKSTYVVIHWADYQSKSGNQGHQSSNSSDSVTDGWYLYHSSDPKWTFQQFTSRRMYGSPLVLFLFVHLHAKGVTTEKEKNLNTEERKALESNTFIPDPNHPDKALKYLCTSDARAHFTWLTTGAVVDTYVNVHYESAVVKRMPANVANLISILKIVGPFAQAKELCDLIPTEDINIWGAGRIENIGLPSDVSIAGYTQETFKEEERSKFQIGAVGAFNDEQLYWWDASIGIPVHKIKDLQYSSSDNTVVASQIDKQSAYAMFNLMLHPVDLSDPKSNLWPRILVGLPLSSKPWDRPFVGGAIGLPIKPVQNFQFFAGVTFNSGKRPATLTVGSPTTNAQLQNNLKIKTTPKFTFGINVPVKSVLDKLLK
jgi:hypothetical protein